ncbi:hypothetical protein L226DRAFT_538834 [Lentinus tigrinus ALCF2SS1-7]|uniref:PIPK domain-containing protein n=1 Tax=Lentinus tigrinus ALCF2SS1-6 TaxID=1328759 RepID=A0A5C2RTN7_9APHY|nr:hypothetical protein L227DRAFT_580956 [Lentinus tigrinus ALCF2SS1-6]RPD70589.1 hypothetical protein L226DRAFT_538834 [Lentinus tigrinus ALCF2SS1-7]
MTRRLLDYIVLVVVAPLIIAAASRHILSLLHDYYLTDDKMEKPLPSLPNSDGRSRKVAANLALTIEARAHLHRFISRALDEEGDLRDRDTWAEKVETSLDELGAGLARGGWLPGLKRARCVRKRHHEDDEKRRTEEQAAKDKEAEEQARNRTAKGRSKLKESIVEDQHVEDEPNDEQRSASLEQLRDAASKPFLPTPKPSIKHLLLTVTGTPASEPTEDMGFKLVRSAVHCSFKTGEFVVPISLSTETADATILYGLDDWDSCLLSTDDPLQVVGGTFRLKGLSSVVQYHALCRVLRLAVYAYLSLALEQDLLANSHVDLHYPKPAIPHLPSFPTTVERSSSSPNVKDKGRRDSGLGLWSFLSKKTEDFTQRASHVAQGLTRRGSLDLGFGQRLPRHTSLPHAPDGGFLARRLSLLSTVSSRASEDTNESNKPIYAVAVRRMDSWKDLLSTSPGVVFYPPKFLLAIAEMEAKDPNRRLVGDEKAALASLLGYHGKESLTRGIVGIHGFIRHQGLPVLYSEHVPGTSTLMSPPPTPNKSDASSDELQFPLRIACGGHRRKWLHYRYYQHGKQWDETLGEAIERWCLTAEDPCVHPDCHFQRSDHDMRWIHGGTGVIATVSLPTSSEASTSDDLVRMWQTCAICGKETPREVIHDGTYLFSFAKYLELLVYSPAIHNLQPSLCEHTTYPAKPWSGPNSPLPQARFNIVRRFSYKDRTVTLTMSEVKEIFEVRVPRLQILRRKAAEKKPADPTDQQLVKVASPPGEAHRTLRREIMKWWQGLSEHMDVLEDKFVSDHPSAFHKTLPRLPSMDDAFEEEDEAALRTPTVRSGAPPSTPLTPRGVPAASNSYPFLPAARSTSPLPSEPVSVSTSVLTTSTATTDTTIDGEESLQLLAGLRHKFQRTEQELYTELSQTSEKSLNDVRRSFVTAARGATRRLAAWEKKHAPQQPSTTSNDTPVAPEPEWWQSGCHAVPGGNVIVREDDWGSIIAFTLSTVDYQRELSNMNGSRSTAPAAPPTTPAAARPSLFRAGESFRRFVSGSAPQQPDPDHDDAGWQEPETYSAVISRKEHPRDPVSLISIRDVLRQKASADAGTSSSLLSPAGTGPGKSSGTETPRSVRAKPAVEVSTAAAGGQVSGMPEAVEAAGKILHELEAVSKMNPSRSSLSDSRHSSSGFVETNIRRGKASSIMSDSDASTVQESAYGVASPPPLPPKDARDSDTEENAQKSSVPPTPDEPPATPSKSSIFTVPFANSLTSAMRYVLKPGETPRPAAGTPHHKLLYADAPSIDDRPHIKYDWTIGKRLRFSCTVYYAKQFDQLRKRCGVDDVFLKSMARSENWAAQGGKSKSNFWKTTDNRFIIKTLVNAWNVADLQVLIDLGPSYFKYMEATASRPTVLAKLLGFYTVEIRNLETGATQAKADLLVMENLFYDRKITKTFDLKGIQGRRVKASSGINSKTLFDGEWIEGQQRALTLVQPHSKVVLQEAIKADCEFLAKSNIMDYSLLLGIDEENKQMVCGLVDTIGSYTFAKTLEYKAKQGLNSGKEVTVVPPNEYQDRFVSAMDDYFLACPDKWSRPLDNTPVPSNHTDLPSVL